MKRFLAALAAILYALPAAAALLPIGGGSGGGGGGGNFATLIASMPHNSWQKLSAGTEGNFTAAMLPRTCANFDGAATAGGTPCTGVGASPWTSDASVAGNAMWGIGSTADQVWAFSKATIIPSDLKLIFTGNGHAAGGDSSFYGFDLNAAANSLLSGGAGGSWDLRVKSARYITSTSTRPAWSAQTAGSDGTGSPWYWATTNADGQQMPIACHTYAYVQNIPGTSKVVYGGTNCYDQNAATRPGGYVVYDMDAATLSNMVVLAAADHNAGTFYGLAQGSGIGVPGPLAFDTDGTAYAVGYSSVASQGWYLFKWTNVAGTPSISEIRLDNTNDTSYVNDDAVILPDPANPGQKLLFQNLCYTAWFSASCHAGVGTGQFMLVHDITGAAPFRTFQAYGNTVPTFSGSVGLAYDSSRNLIIVSMGDAHLYTLDPTTWQWGELTASPTCNPSCPAISGDSNQSFIRNEHIASPDAFVMAGWKQVFVYRP